jgi:hypothetical protein
MTGLFGSSRVFLLSRLKVDVVSTANSKNRRQTKQRNLIETFIDWELMFVKKTSFFIPIVFFCQALNPNNF